MPNMGSFMNIGNLRDAIKNGLETLNVSIESAIRKELSIQFDLGHSGKLQFEIDPFYYCISLVQTENEILESFELDEKIENAAEESNLDIIEVTSVEIVTWFASRWKSVDGPKHYSPAYLFFHGGLEASRYDLEKGCW